MKGTKYKLEAMKQQTIGVEVEMYNITRDKAAQVVADFFGTTWAKIYGHGSIYDVHQIIDQKGRAWEISRDSSIKAPDDMRTELGTPILKYEDIEELQRLLRALRHAGAKSDPNHCCGVHVHIGSDDMTAQQIRNLVNIMAAHETLLIHAIQIDGHRASQYCQTVDPDFLKALNKEKPKTREQVKNIWYYAQGDAYNQTSHYNPSRYHMLNLHGTFEGCYYNHTIEFRLFQFDNPGHNYKGGIHCGKMKAYIQLCLAMVQAAKDVRTASPKEPQHDNEKYAMRCWLLRLGMIGPEFATARKWLTDRLSGDAAFRYGRQAA